MTFGDASPTPEEPGTTSFGCLISVIRGQGLRIQQGFSPLRRKAGLPGRSLFLRRGSNGVGAVTLGVLLIATVVLSARNR